MDLLTINEVAAILNRPVKTLYDWRLRKFGPRSALIGGKLAYRRADVEAWVEEQFAKADS